jgi:hypothetical protein
MAIADSVVMGIVGGRKTSTITAMMASARPNLAGQHYFVLADKSLRPGER